MRRFSPLLGLLCLLSLPYHARSFYSFSSPAKSSTLLSQYIQVLSDVDDTLKSSGGVSVGSVALGGVDAQYGRGEVYPGVFQFMLELSKGGGEGRPMNVAVLTARAEEVSVCVCVCACVCEM